MLKMTFKFTQVVQILLNRKKTKHFFYALHSIYKGCSFISIYISKSKEISIKSERERKRTKHYHLYLHFVQKSKVNYNYNESMGLRTVPLFHQLQ